MLSIKMKTHIYDYFGGNAENDYWLVADGGPPTKALRALGEKVLNVIGESRDIRIERGSTVGGIFIVGGKLFLFRCLYGENDRHGRSRWVLFVAETMLEPNNGIDILQVFNDSPFFNEQVPVPCPAGFPTGEVILRSMESNHLVPETFPKNISRNELSTIICSLTANAQKYKEVFVFFRKIASENNGDTVPERFELLTEIRKFPQPEPSIKIKTPSVEKSLLARPRKSQEVNQNTHKFHFPRRRYAGILVVLGMIPGFIFGYFWHSYFSLTAEKSIADVAALTQKAESGKAAAQFSLGKCYFSGDGVEMDKKQAVHWFRKAAEQGNMDAQGMLGVCYANGENVEKNSIEALAWFYLARKNGLESINEHIIFLEKQLGHQNKVSAEKRAREIEASFH
jgi:hypothetical protein